MTRAVESKRGQRHPIVLCWTCYWHSRGCGILDCWQEIKYVREGKKWTVNSRGVAIIDLYLDVISRIKNTWEVKSTSSPCVSETHIDLAQPETLNLNTEIQTWSVIAQPEHRTCMALSTQHHTLTASFVRFKWHAHSVFVSFSGTLFIDCSCVEKRWSSAEKAGWDGSESAKKGR